MDEENQMSSSQNSEAADSESVCGDIATSGTGADGDSSAPPDASSVYNAYICINCVIDDMCPEGDIILGVWFLSTKRNRIDQKKRLKVSSLVLRMASVPFRDAMNNIQRVRGAPDLSNRHPQFSTWTRTLSDHVLLCFELVNDREFLSLVILPPLHAKMVDAISMVFRILHCREVCDELSELSEIVLVAKIAWALNCLSPIKPWINLWLSKRSWTAEATNDIKSPFSPESVCGILGLVMNDEVAFAIATQKWVLEYSTQELKRISQSHMSVLPPKFEASMVDERKRSLMALSSVLTDMYNEYRAPDVNKVIHLGKTIAMGAFIRGIHCFLGTDITRILDWEASLSELLAKLQRLSEDLTDTWSELYTPLKKSIDGGELKFVELTDPGLTLRNRIQGFEKGITGLRLAQYRSGTVKHLDVARYFDLGNKNSNP